MEYRVFAFGAESEEVLALLCEYLQGHGYRKTAVAHSIVRVLVTREEGLHIGCSVVPLAPLSEAAIRSRFHCTRMQARVARLVASRLTNEEIAQVLTCKEGTIRTHLGWVYAKLDAHSRDDAIEKLKDPSLYSDDGGGNGG